MAAMKKSIWSNIIKMKLTEKNRREALLELFLVVVSCWNGTRCVGNVHKVSRRRVAEFDFLMEMEVKLVLTHFDFHLSAIFITLCPNCCGISIKIL